MNNKEIGTLSNMITVYSTIKIKKSYTEDEYADIYKLVDGYKILKKYFYNSNEIENILNIKINDNKLFDLIRITRNRVAHIDKNNCEDSLVLLVTDVDINDIHDLLNKIGKGMDDIFNNQLEKNIYKLLMNNRMIVNLYSIMGHVINNKEPINEFDEKSRKELQPIFNSFDYKNSTIDEFLDFQKNIIEYYKREDTKKGIIDLYGEEVYNDLYRMITDDSFTDDDVKRLLEKIEKENK